MKQCPKCYTPNTEASQYCESCGTPLRQGETSYQTATPYQQQTYSPPIQYPVPEPVYPVASVPPTYHPTYAPAWRALSGRLVYNTEGTRKRSGIGIFFGVVLYVLGGIVVAFGLASCFIPAHNDALTAVGFIIGLLLSLLGLALTLTLHRTPLLRGWLRIILFIVISVLAAIALVGAFATSVSDQTTGSEY
ncbi:MAG TPA: zinc ribbon domain-containing protein, partial [Ktedonobacteraceae bacterium]